MRNTALWSSTHIPNIIDLSRKKQLFDLEIKGQGPTKVITVRDTPPYGHALTYQISMTYLERQKFYGPEEKILFKKNYLTLRSKVKLQCRSLRYTKHRLMVIHPHTKYHWPISKETIIWPWDQRSRSHEGHCYTRHTALWSSIHIPNSIDLSRNKKMLWPGQENTI
jgi:hypothetical protein